MRKIVVQIIFSVLCLSAQAQKVSNIRAEQRGQEIVVLYSLETAIPCEVSLLLSQNDGYSWSTPLKNVSGDVGNNIGAGEKQINWKVLEEREQLIGENIKFKVVVTKREKVLTQEELDLRNKRRKFWLDVADWTVSILFMPALIGLMVLVWPK